MKTSYKANLSIINSVVSGDNPSFNIKWRYEKDMGQGDNRWKIDSPRLVVGVKIIDGTPTITSDVPHAGVYFNLIFTGTTYFSGSSSTSVANVYWMAEDLPLNSIVTINSDYVYDGIHYLIAQNKGNDISLTSTINKDMIMNKRYKCVALSGSYVNLPQNCLIAIPLNKLPASDGNLVDGQMSIDTKTNDILPNIVGMNNEDIDEHINNNDEFTFAGSFDFHEEVINEWLNEQASKLRFIDSNLNETVNIIPSLDTLNVNKDAQFNIPINVNEATPGTIDIIYQRVLISELWKLKKELEDRLHAVEVASANITSDELEEAASGSEAERLATIKNKYRTVVPSE